MDYITKSFRSMFGLLMYCAIALAVIFLFVNIFPTILLLGLIAFVGYRGFKTVKLWFKNKSGIVTSMNGDEVHSKDDSEEYFNGNIIDVEYKDVN